MGYARTHPGPGNECGLSLGEVSGRPAGRPHDLDDGSYWHYFYHSSSVSIGITINIIIVVVIVIVIIDIIIVVVISMPVMTS